MGMFLSMSGVIGGQPEEVRAALEQFARLRQGSLVAESLDTDNDECLVICPGKGGVTVMYPSAFMAWDHGSEFLSRQLGKPVFMFHIHDSDFWMYAFYENGEVVDQFNPMPDYWEELDDEERDSWKGSAAAVARRVPGLAEEQIARYLIRWGEELLESSERG